MNIRRVALYIRVSTVLQNSEMQARELREYVRRRGWKIHNVYCDKGVSGATDRRPALNQLIADACRKDFDAILVWRLDRWARSLKHLVNSIAELQARGVAFMSLRDNIDLSTPTGVLMMQLLGSMAEFERALIRERVVAGVAAARERGKRLGRPPLKVLTTDEIRSLRQDRGRKMPFRKLAEKYGVSVFAAHSFCAKGKL